MGADQQNPDWMIMQIRLDGWTIERNADEHKAAARFEELQTGELAAAVFLYDIFGNLVDSWSRI